MSEPDRRADVPPPAQLSAPTQPSVRPSAVTRIGLPRWAASMDAAGLGTFDYNLRTGVLDWDTRLIAMFGFADDDQFDRSVEAFNRRVHPDDLELITGAMAEAAATLGPLQAVYRIVLPDGQLRLMQVRGSAVAGADGTAERLIGVVFDLSDAEAKEQRAEQVLELMSVGFVRLDPDWTVTYVNAEAERLTHGDRAQMIGRTLWDLFPATLGEPFEPVYRRVAATRVAETVEGFYPAPLNSWFEIRVVPEPGGGVGQYFMDVGERRSAQQLLQLSADVGERLVGASDVSEAAAAMADSVVPLLADWSIVALRESDGSVRDVRGAHRDPSRRSLLSDYMAHHMDDGGTGVVQEVMASRRPAVMEAEEIATAQERLPSSAAQAALSRLAPGTVAIYPLQSGTRSVGALVLARDPGRPPLTAAERSLRATISRRAGLAIDNARLNEDLAAAAAHDRSVAAELQQALLTALPEPDHLHLVARYLTAVDPDQVGGDWTDALVQPNGAVTVMVGDVAGHDIRAAASMGQLRGMLRTFTWLDDSSPARLLGQLDRAARDMHIEVTATALVARVEQSAEQAASGLRTVRWSSAGHPPPIVLHSDGRTEVLTAPGGNDVMLGVVPDSDRTDHTWTADPESTLLLYTDGLVETREASIDAGIARLGEALTRHRHLDLDDLVDAVLVDLIGDRRQDDTALVAVRFHRQDRPRPPEAGPAHL